jgi:hypothetical protein
VAKDGEGLQEAIGSKGPQNGDQHGHRPKIQHPCPLWPYPLSAFEFRCLDSGTVGRGLAGRFSVR